MLEVNLQAPLASLMSTERKVNPKSDHNTAVTWSNCEAGRHISSYQLWGRSPYLLTSLLFSRIKNSVGVTAETSERDGSKYWLSGSSLKTFRSNSLRFICSTTSKNRCAPHLYSYQSSDLSGCLKFRLLLFIRERKLKSFLHLWTHADNRNLTPLAWRQGKKSHPI